MITLLIFSFGDLSFAAPFFDCMHSSNCAEITVICQFDLMTSMDDSLFEMRDFLSIFLPQILLDISMFIFFHAIELLVFQKRQQLEPILLKLELYKVRNPVQSSFRFTNHLSMFVKQMVPLRT